MQRVLGAPPARDDEPLASALLAVMPRLRAAEAVALLGTDMAPCLSERLSPDVPTVALQQFPCHLSWRGVCDVVMLDMGCTCLFRIERTRTSRRGHETICTRALQAAVPAPVQRNVSKLARIASTGGSAVPGGHVQHGWMHMG